MSLYLLFFQITLFLFAAIPCAIPFSHAPNPVFPSELAAFVGVMLLVFIAGVLPGCKDSDTEVSGRKSRFAFPWAALPWLGLIVLIIIQWVAMPTIYLTERWYPIIYGVSALMGVMALARGRDEFGIMPLAEALAWGLLAGALFNACISVPQVIELLKRGTRLIYGHIGQKNMYGHYLAWGLAAATWLVAERKLSQWIFWPIAAWLTLSMAWCGSRSVFTYAAAWLFLGFFLIVVGRNAENAVARRFGFFLSIAAVLILLMQFVAPLISDLLKSMLDIEKNNKIPTGFDRFSSNGARRLVEWKKAWITFMDYPLLGVGWGLYPAQSVILQVRPEFARVIESVLFTHCHNSVLNIMAETGVVGTLLIMGGVAVLTLGLSKRWRESPVLLGMSLISVSISHSLVEYPLWYFHLLGPFTFGLFLFCGRRFSSWTLPVSMLRWVWIGVSLGGMMLAISGWNLYARIHPLMEATYDPEVDSRRILKLNALRGHPLIDYYAESALSNYIVPSAINLHWKLDIFRRLNAVRPYYGQLTKGAVLEALDGHLGQARKLIRYAAYAFPETLGDYYYELHYLPAPEAQALRLELEDAAQFFQSVRPGKSNRTE